MFSHGLRFTASWGGLLSALVLLPLLSGCGPVRTPQAEPQKPTPAQDVGQAPPRGSRCSRVAVKDFGNATAVFPLRGDTTVCVDSATECVIGNNALKGKIAGKFCQEQNTACRDQNNDDCLGNQDCVGILDQGSGNIVLTSCAASGQGRCGSGRLLCGCAAELPVGAELECKCGCRGEGVFF